MKHHTRLVQLSLAAVAALALVWAGACGSDAAPTVPSSPGSSMSTADATALGNGPYQGGPQGGNQGDCQGDGPQTGCQGDCQGDCTANLQGGLTTAQLQEALEAALQDEYHARYTYQGVLNTFGGTTLPFANIVRAEQQHAASIVTLYARRNILAPTSEWTLNNVPTFGTVKAACAAAAQAEVANIAIYDQWLNLALPQDVRNVFTNNRKASKDYHLPAFESCR